MKAHNILEIKDQKQDQRTLSRRKGHLLLLKDTLAVTKVAGTLNLHLVSMEDFLGHTLALSDGHHTLKVSDGQQHLAHLRQPPSGVLHLAKERVSYTMTWIS